MTIDATPESRNAHHEAGHAVAVVHVGGELRGVSLGRADWADATGASDRPGETRHRTPPLKRPIVTFAGVWAEARWMQETGVVEADTPIWIALDAAWENNFDGDRVKYAAVVEQVDETAVRLGLGPVGREWEADWIDELEPLWPAVCAVAAALLRGEIVTHATVQAALDRLPSAI